MTPLTRLSAGAQVQLAEDGADVMLGGLRRDEQTPADLCVRQTGLAARERGFLHDQHTPTMFAVRDLVKDLELGLRAYGESAVAAPLTQQTRELYAHAMRESADLDISAIVRNGSPPQ